MTVLLFSQCRMTFCVGIVSLVVGVQVHDQEPTGSGRSPAAPVEVSSDAISLFDGRSLDGWTLTEFGGERGVGVVDGVIQLEAGGPLTGITFRGEPPTNDFELALEARKLKGSDFFCAATFPVEDSHCTLVLGGWGGTTVGLSCLDGKDASENETTQYIKFEPDRWYAIRIRVADSKIQCWLDGDPIIDVSYDGRKVSLRTEVLRSRPLGFCSYSTQAQLRELTLTRLDRKPSTDQFP